MTKLYTTADTQKGGTGNPITEQDALDIAAGTNPDQLRWDPIEPLTPGYDPVPVFIHKVSKDVATFSIVNSVNGVVIPDKFTIDLTDREHCHEGLPSTPRKNLGGKKRIVILMLCPTYHEAAKADTGRTFAKVATDATVGLTATGKWPQTESSELIKLIVEHVVSGKKVDLKFLRSLYKQQLARRPQLYYPPALGPL